MLENALVYEWYDKWLVLLVFLASLALTIWIFNDSIHTLDDSTVGRSHIRVRWQAGQFTLHDLASRNGTFVNGERIERPHLLRSGDTIKIGNTELAFMEVKEGAKA